jgi:ABC-type uncharacterized transport system substrate-binding protein
VAIRCRAALSRPGGNITGTTFLDPELVAKQLAPLKELLPTASRVAVLWNPKAFSEQTIAGMVKQTAEPRGVQILHYGEVPALDAFERAIADAASGQPDAVSVSKPNIL